jgi:hypothetical protein
VARRITAVLERTGIRALNPPLGFPMEADRWGFERMWVVAHKLIAVAAGLGRMGIESIKSCGTFRARAPWPLPDGKIDAWPETPPRACR